MYTQRKFSKLIVCKVWLFCCFEESIPDHLLNHFETAFRRLCLKSLPNIRSIIYMKHPTCSHNLALTHGVFISSLCIIDSYHHNSLSSSVRFLARSKPGVTIAFIQSRSIYSSLLPTWRFIFCHTIDEWLPAIYLSKSRFSKIENPAENMTGMYVFSRQCQKVKMFSLCHTFLHFVVKSLSCLKSKSSTCRMLLIIL